MEHYVCPRCGNEDPRLVAYRNGKPYCRACVSFQGRRAEGIFSVGKEITLRLDYPLSPKQKECSTSVLEALRAGKDVLVHAVTGAGKTELVFASMASYLQRRLRVGFATPRKDVVLDLKPRIEKAFPRARVVAVYGSHSTTLEGDIVCLTTHQLYRYENYFDLLILDEIDAFPYRGNRVLSAFFERSVRGRKILLSATATEEDRKKMEEGGGVVVTLYERYHHGLLPVPRVQLCHSLLLKENCRRLLSSLLTKGKPVFVFVPTIEEGWELFRFLSFFLDGGAFVSSKSVERSRDIARFKRGELHFLVTTSILERGVTVRDLQVLVYDAANPIYDAPSLIQIAGRAGRKADAKTGIVCFLADEKTEAMANAIKEIRRCNGKAAMPVLP